MAIKVVATAVSVGVITLAFSGSAIGNDYRASELPRSNGHIEDWYFPATDTQR